VKLGILLERAKCVAFRFVSRREIHFAVVNSQAFGDVSQSQAALFIAPDSHVTSYARSHWPFTTNSTSALLDFPSSVMAAMERGNTNKSRKRDFDPDNGGKSCKKANKVHELSEDDSGQMTAPRAGQRKHKVPAATPQLLTTQGAISDDDNLDSPPALSDSDSEQGDFYGFQPIYSQKTPKGFTTDRPRKSKASVPPVGPWHQVGPMAMPYQYQWPMAMMMNPQMGQMPFPYGPFPGCPSSKDDEEDNELLDEDAVSEAVPQKEKDKPLKPVLVAYRLIYIRETFEKGRPPT